DSADERGISTHSAIALWIVAAILLITGLVLTVPRDPDWWQVVVLGIVEGVTEFLPISSTGHLLVAAQVLHFQHDLGGTFEIFIQLGAVIAVVGYYLRDLLAQVRDVTHSKATQHFWLAILIAFLPAALVGVALHKQIQHYLFQPWVIATTLIVGGIVFIMVEQLTRRFWVHKLEDVSRLQALTIGLAQTLALIPGVSRSGGAIIGGMLGGLDRRTATAFSFYLAIPTLGSATIFDLLANLNTVSPDDYGRLFLGLVVSMIVAWLSIGWLLHYVAHHSFVAFGIYRIFAGVVIFALLATNVL
ncbi:MAG TPA: undecaprenyl-diphosphate phosphatase, partial [Ktedonobacterales bacterium]|nr:undecaprenyl-diphosphate phosphatase [Ktedonobacterales bacterium]